MIAFTVPGKPQPWRRAQKNGKRHFKDAKTQANQNHWAWLCKAAMGSTPIASGPIDMTVTVRYGIPIRTSKALRAAMLAGEVRPVVRPDADNVAKNADALNGVAFDDDAQIVRLLVEKFYAAEPGVDVTIQPLTAGA